MAHLLQRVKSTGQLYYGGEVETDTQVWIQQHYDSTPLYSTVGMALPSAIATGTQVTYLRQNEDIWLAEVDKPIGKVRGFDEVSI